MATDVHLCLLLHGLYGSPSNLWCLEESVQAAHDAAPSNLELAVLNASSYSGPKTWDGVDVIAHGVALELDEEISRLQADGKRVTYLSVTGYSLGGLIARTLVGQLYARPGFFQKHKPAFFSTIATPHLGVLRYGSWRSSWMHAVGRHMFSRTGQQLFCIDSDHGDPFLMVLADPSRIYYRALLQFDRVCFVANGVGDLTVPYCTAAAVSHDPFVDYEQGRIGLEVDGHLVRHWYEPEEEDVVDAIVTTETGRLVPPATGRPWLPPVFHLPYRPLRYALIPLIPVMVPVALTLLAMTMTYHNIRSSRRLRPLVAGEHPHYRRIFGLEEKDYDVSGETPTVTRPSSPSGSKLRGSALSREIGIEELQDSDDGESSVCEVAAENGEGILNEGDECVECEEAAENGADPPEAELVQAGGAEPSAPVVPLSQPLLTPLQQRIVAELSAIPQLERIVAWFPHVFNAHAVIIARNARNPKWEWQGIGRQVIQAWAEKVVGAVNELAAA